MAKKPTPARPEVFGVEAMQRARTRLGPQGRAAARGAVGQPNLQANPGQSVTNALGAVLGRRTPAKQAPRPKK